MFCAPQDDQMSEGGMDRACDMYGREEKYTVGFGGEIWSKETT
jgi:hypothetical protein